MRICRELIVCLLEAEKLNHFIKKQKFEVYFSCLTVSSETMSPKLGGTRSLSIVKMSERHCLPSTFSTGRDKMLSLISFTILKRHCLQDRFVRMRDLVSGIWEILSPVSICYPWGPCPSEIFLKAGDKIYFNSKFSKIPCPLSRFAYHGDLVPQKYFQRQGTRYFSTQNF